MYALLLMHACEKFVQSLSRLLTSLTEGATMTSVCPVGHEHDLMLCYIGFAKDQRKLEEIIGELEKQGVKP